MTDAPHIPLLIPTPRQVVFLGSWVELAPGEEPRVRARPAPAAASGSTRAQAYTVEVLDPAQNAGILFEITASSDAGRRYAATTIGQLLRQYQTRIPRVRISDEPSFATRGVMLDISRNRVPTMPEFFGIIDSLSELKINHLQLYTEHTFAYEGHEDAWRGCSPLTPEEVRQLDQYASERGIELVANQNCFGHLAHWLRLPKYQHLAETHGDWMFDVWPRSGPFSLCPVDPASEALVADLLGQLLPCFKSVLVNIGCDETYDVGWGRSKAEVEKRGGMANGRAAVYLEFVERVCKLVRSHGRRPMFWADIALSHPERIGDIPADLISLAWGYEPHSPFDDWCRQLREAGREVWVCPGTSSWRSTTGRTRERSENLRSAANAGVAHGVSGYLICDWGDTGHHQVWPIALHAIAHGAQAAWNAERSVDGFSPEAVSLHVFDDASLKVGSWLQSLGDADEPLRRVAGRLSRPKQEGEFALWNQSAMFADLHNCTLTDRAEVGDIELWKDAFGRIEEAWVNMPAGLSKLLDDELEHTISVARLALRRAIGRRASGGLSTAERATLLEMATNVRAEHRRLWGLRSREGGLEASCGHYDKIINELRGN